MEYLIVADTFRTAQTFTAHNGIHISKWSYATSEKSFMAGPTIVILNSWKRKRCILQQTLLKASLAWHKYPTVYMAEDERLDLYDK